MINKIIRGGDSLGNTMNIYPLCPLLPKTHGLVRKTSVQNRNRISFEKKWAVNRSKNSPIKRVTADYKHHNGFPERAVARELNFP
jgi:hypothetical protein